MAALAKLLAFENRRVVRTADAFRLTAPELPPQPPMPKKPHRRRKPPVSLSDAQLLALLQRAKDHRVRDWVMILVTYWHGLRASETIGLRVRDFDLNEWTVQISRGKGSDVGQQQTLQEHENPLLNEREAVSAWLRNRNQFGLKGGAKRRSGQIGKLGGKYAKAAVGKIVVGSADHIDCAGAHSVGADSASPSLGGKDASRGGTVSGDHSGSPSAIPHPVQGKALVVVENCLLGGDGPRLFAGAPGAVETLIKMQQSTQNVAFLPICHPERSEGPAFPENGHPGTENCLIKPAGGYEPALTPPLAVLGPFPAPEDPSQRLFPVGRGQFWRIVHKYALAAGIPRRKCKTHMLKHTIAKHLVRAGHPLNEIQEWMGWGTIETMNWYTRADEEELGTSIGDRIRAKQGLRQVQQGSLFS
jgi:integrase